MGALFLAMPPGEMSANARGPAKPVIRAALGRRAPGATLEHEDERYSLLVSARDTHVCHAPHGLLVVDGWLGESPAAHAGLVAQWHTSGVLPLEECRGQFAAVACCWSTGDVEVVRDRFGTRSIVWCEVDGARAVASEPAILHAAGVPLRIAPDVLAASLRFRWITGTEQLLAPVQQVPMGHRALLHAHAAAETQRYWQMAFTPESPARMPMSLAVERTRDALRDSLETVVAGGRRPVVLLSGGVDSSVLAALLRDVAPGTLAITGQLPDSANPELGRAEFVAAHLGMPLRVVSVNRPTESEFTSSVDRVQELPRNPNNVVLQQLLHAAANEGDVVLQGDGAEVLFGLVDTETVARFSAKYQVVGAMPGVLRRWLAAVSDPLSGPLVSRARRLLMHTPDSYAATLAEIRYRDAVRRRLPPTAIYDHVTHDLRAIQRALGHAEDALHVFQMESELMSSLLRHDRLAQGAGITSVAPFLLPAVVRSAQQLPRELRNAGRSRAVVRAVCDALLPDEVSRWPKLGFEVPWSTWLAPIAATLGEPHPAWALLPEGFVREAVRANDPEALWSAFALRTLVDTFDRPARSSISPH